MSIQEITQDFKRFMNEGDGLIMLLIILLAGGSFGLGRLSVRENMETLPLEVVSEEATVHKAVEETTRTDTKETPPLTETTKRSIPQKTTPPSVSGGESGYVASKNGTKYHLPWCSGAKNMKEENKIWFKTKAEAEAAGYSPASNCKGI